MARFRFKSRQVQDPAAQQNFEQLEGILPITEAMLADDAVTFAKLATGAIMDDADLRIVAGCVASERQALRLRGLRA